MPGTSKKRKTRKPWALLAYTVADDAGPMASVDGCVRDELRAICRAADSDCFSVAAQVDFKNTPGLFRATLRPRPRTAYNAPRADRTFKPAVPRAYPLWRAIAASARNSTVNLQKARDRNAARAAVLRQFLRYGQRECPAHRYVVFFYGHACGPMGLFYDRENDRSAPTTLRLTDLADSLECVRRRKAAIIMFRGCYIDTLEMAYQLRNVGEYAIAGQSIVPTANVWPWEDVVPSLLPSARSEEVATLVAIHLAVFLRDRVNRGRYSDVPYSVIDLRQADAVVPPLRALVRGLQAARGNPRRRAACARALEGARGGTIWKDENRKTVRKPGDLVLLDVQTMCDRLQAVPGDDVAGPARGLREIVRTRLITWHRARTDACRGISLYYGPATDNMRAISVIEPSKDEDIVGDAAYYAQLALSRATGWHRIALDPLRA